MYVMKSIVRLTLYCSAVAFTLSACHVVGTNGGLGVEFGPALRPTEKYPSGPQPWPENIASASKLSPQFTMYTQHLDRIHWIKPEYYIERIGEIKGLPVADLSPWIGRGGPVPNTYNYLPNGKLVFKRSEPHLSAFSSGNYWHFENNPLPPGRYRVRVKNIGEVMPDAYDINSSPERVPVGRLVRKNKYDDFEIVDGQEVPIREPVYTSTPQTIEFDMHPAEKVFIRMSFTPDHAHKVFDWKLTQVSYETAKAELSQYFVFPQ